ncbi:protease complex subunit PrcB family protein [bacterium]|nr:protease complex subunit PrcB family protein [bacterium]
MIRIFTSTLLCFLAFSGCKNQPVADLGPDEVLYFETVGMGHNGSLRDTTEVVFSESSAFQTAVAELNLLGPIANVDFSQTMVGFIAIPTESGGYIIEVKSVEKTGNEIIVSYEFSKPGQDCVTIQALSLPFQIVKIKRSEGVVRFNRIEKQYSCSL